MSESTSITDSPHLTALQEQREGLGLEALDIPLLQVLAGSQDLRVSHKAKWVLNSKWQIQSERDASDAETIDLMQLMDEYSPEEQIIIVSQLVNIQLTDGCNGGCFFCMYGSKKGVVAKLSFDSVVAFLTKFNHLIPPNPILYGDSDPFDYRDGDKHFLNIYKFWRQLRPLEYQYISTSIPKGGEKNFIDFARFLAQEQKGIKEKQNSHSVVLRISLGTQNTQRVEATFRMLNSILLEDGFSQPEINQFMTDCMEFGGRTSADLLNLGSLIKESDDIRDIQTPACRDGIRITPNGIHGVIITTPTVYEPSGEKSILLSPGLVASQTPKRIRVQDYTSFFWINSLRDRTRGNRTMLPTIRTADNHEYQLVDKVDNQVLRLGRETASIGRLIEDLSEVYILPNSAKQSAKYKQEFIRAAVVNYQLRRQTTSALIERAKLLVNKSELQSQDIEKVNFYIFLTETYMAEMDFLATQADSGLSDKVISVLAVVFRQVGRAQVEKLPEIFEDLLDFCQEMSDDPRAQTSSFEIEDGLIYAIGQYFGIKLVERSTYPKWIKSIAKIFNDQNLPQLN